MPLILGIETSCDETAAAIVRDGDVVVSNVVASQIKQHAPYGGVVPELAAREHLKALRPVLEQTMAQAEMTFNDLDAVAVTSGPGLMPALLVGLNFAKGVALNAGLPLIGVNHFLAHICGAFLDGGSKELMDSGNYPILALVVSGGHSSLLLIEADGSARQVGFTIDDAAGEALDKAAKLLHLGYPGGPVIQKTAEAGDPSKYHFPRPLTGAAGKPVAPEHRFNFSFSGIKTALLYHSRREGDENGLLSGQLLHDSVASYQEAIVDVLCRKTMDAAKHYNASSLVLCGGVACNSVLRERLAEKSPKHLKLFIAERKYCTDNAAMVAGLGYYMFRRGEFAAPDIDAFARLPLISHAPFVPEEVKSV